MKSLVGGLAVAAMSMLPAPANASTIVDIGGLGGFGTYPAAINNSAQIAGTGSNGSTDHAFLYSGGTMTDLGVLPTGTASGAHAINQSGVVVGYSNVSGTSKTHPFVYSGGTMTDLFSGSLTNWNGEALSINSSGIIAGWMANPSAVQNPYTYSGGVFTDLSAAGMWSGAYPNGINRDMQIAGRGISGAALAFIYQSSTTTSLSTLGGTQSEALAINSLGQVVGQSQITGNTANHAFLWSPAVPGSSTGSMVDLGTLGGSNSTARAINAWGVVVGDSGVTGGGTHAFIYTECGGMVDLNTLLPGGSGWTVEQAMGINDKGQITGVGTNGSGSSRGFLFTP